MDAARWQRIEEICFHAFELPPRERSAYLDAASAGDADLRAAVEQLLAQLDLDPSFLEQPLVQLPSAASSHDEPDQDFPARIGTYRVVRRLGRGGMGDVFLAVRETEDLEQQVALKIIRRGFDSDDVVRRFRQERRMLASLSHPNIATLFDASTTEDGRPYFVMEYVDGQPIDEYCTSKKLSIDQRLNLFQTICRAVQHAHQQLVVHRDLKPRNILVTNTGVPKLLDFGIAKALAPSDTPASAETGTNMRLLTPQYAAPEQIRGGSITTATDVYLLGILLYELLTGKHPYAAAGASMRDLELAATDPSPSLPSSTAESEQIRKELSGDLDTIILKALRKEPERRYDSAAAFADDIQRFRDALPVSARPDTLRYRARKFIRRNSRWVATGVTAVLALAATTVVTLVQSARVRAESERVTQERDKANEVRSFLMEMFGAADANRTVGDTVTVRRLLDLQAAKVDSQFARNPELHGAMLEVLADGYDRLGLYKEAEPLALRSLEVRRKALRPDHPDVATSLNALGWSMHQNGKSIGADSLLLEAIAIRRAAGDRYLEGLARSLNDRGVVLNDLRRFAEAESLLVEARTIRIRLLGENHRAVGITSSNLAAAYYFQAKLDSAIPMMEKAVAVLAAAVGADHQRTIVALGNLAAFRTAKGELQAATAIYRDILERQTRIQGADHPVTIRVLASLAASLNSEAMVTRNDSQLAESRALYEKALTLQEKSLGESHPQVGITVLRLSGVLLSQNNFREALALGERALRIHRASFGDKHQNTAPVFTRVATINMRLGRTDEAIRMQRLAISAFDSSLAPKNVQSAQARVTLCEMLLSAGMDRLPSTEATCVAAMKSCTDANGMSPGTIATAQLYVARVQLRQGKRAAADSLLDVARRAIESGAGTRTTRALLDSLSSAAKTTR